MQLCIGLFTQGTRVIESALRDLLMLFNWENYRKELGFRIEHKDAGIWLLVFQEVMVAC